MLQKVLCVFLFFPLLAITQVQLISNPGFEDSVALKPSHGCNSVQTYAYPLTRGWYQVGGSVDYYNSDLSLGLRKTQIHKARTGQGRIGLVLGENARRFSQANYREYLQTRLKEPLKAGTIYSVNFYIVRDRRSVFYAPQAGICFSGNPMRANSGYAMEGASPQVITNNYDILAGSDKWNLVHGYYKAVGGEQYLTIGNFDPNGPLLLDGKSVPPKLLTNDYGWYAYYYIDDIYVYEVQDTAKDNFRDLIPRSLAEQPFNNLVFVLDVSMSMQKEGKIKKLKEAVDQFLSSLDTNEIISVVTFDASPLVLARHVKSSCKRKITAAIDSLRASGGTNVNAAILKAYNLLDSAFIPGGNNRVILVTDAGFQVSPHTKGIIEEHSTNSGIGFSTLVFNDVVFHHVKKLCRKNKGTYINLTDQNTATALNSQASERKIEAYGKGHKRRYMYFTVRLVLLLLVAAYILFKFRKSF